MLYFFAEYETYNLLGFEDFALCICDPLCRFHVCTNVSTIPNPPYVLFWDDKRVPRVQRVNVEEAIVIVILVYFVGSSPFTILQKIQSSMLLGLDT